MIKTKSPSQWQALYQQYESSGLSITKFCKQQRISTSSFYKHREIQSPAKSFIQAQVTNHHSQRISLQSPMPSSIRLNTKTGILSLPLEIQPSFLAQLIRGLA